MSDPEREDLLIQDSLWPPDDYRKVTDAEFDAIARQEGYVRLENKVDLEAVRQGWDAYTHDEHGMAALAWAVLAKAYLAAMLVSDDE